MNSQLESRVYQTTLQVEEKKTVATELFWLFDKIVELIAVSLHIFNYSYELALLFYELRVISIGFFYWILHDKVWLRQ